ncbi:hypothetical protein Godav_019475 [Gossypium davidsonii]|uniref:Uncharacterized protein n=1 Tax=Gossypium davidsonii TaxID=34287 RepID=A0A7J8R0R5_GOSDV|nr:hypothetical protein [Gossypium davidsonii]
MNYNGNRGRNPCSNTYNPRWIDHPNLRWGRNQGGEDTQQAEAEPKPEEVVELVVEPKEEPIKEPVLIRVPFPSQFEEKQRWDEAEFRVLENVLVKVRNFIIPVEFVILDFEEDHEIPILLGRPFLAMSRSTIDPENELTMKINVPNESGNSESRTNGGRWSGMMDVERLLTETKPKQYLRWPEGRDFLSPPRDDILQERRSSNGRKLAIHEDKEELNRKLNVYPIR